MTAENERYKALAMVDRLALALANVEPAQEHYGWDAGDYDSVCPVCGVDVIWDDPGAQNEWEPGCTDCIWPWAIKHAALLSGD